MFFRGSRYEAVADAEIPDPGGRTIRYKRMRFIPELIGRLGYTVREGDRPDLAANAALGDPEVFWRLADFNRQPRPVDLTETPGRRLRVPNPG